MKKPIANHLNSAQYELLIKGEFNRIYKTYSENVYIYARMYASAKTKL